MTDLDLHRATSLRFDTSRRPLEPGDLEADPLVQFRAWFGEAVAAGVLEPRAMTLATADVDGRPSARTVLLRDVDGDGFAFFTNYQSRKGRELAANPFAALVFRWLELGRQVTVTGSVARLPEAASDAYFATRPRESQIAAWASAQSAPLADRAVLDALVAEVDRRYEGMDVPRPQFWGGLRLVPASVEFWQGRQHRLHDRLRYLRQPYGAWRVDRLNP